MTHTAFLITHLVGLVLGVGGALLTDTIFVLCIRRQRVGHTLVMVMEAASRLVMVGYLLLVISGVGLLASGSAVTNKFIAKMIVVAIVGVNGTVAQLVVFPKLQRKITRRDPTVTIGFLHQLSVVAAVSGVSWFTALVLGAWKTSAWPIMAWVVVYLLAVSLAVCVALLMTPAILKVDDPEFDSMFPVLAAKVQRSQITWQGPARRALPATTEPPPKE